MSVQTPQHLLAARNTTVLILALLAWGSICVASSPTRQVEPNRKCVIGRFVDCRAAVSAANGVATDPEDSDDALSEPAPEWPNLAEAGHPAVWPESTPLVTHCSVLRSISQNLVVFAPTPDHLIELPGTPPPGLI